MRYIPHQKNDSGRFSSRALCLSLGVSTKKEQPNYHAHEEYKHEPAKKDSWPKFHVWASVVCSELINSGISLSRELAQDYSRAQYPQNQREFKKYTSKQILNWR
ncbi:hypothetical protein HCUR_00421 [Holospora curviuscula]|uniref:Uncharacterized protein n=1 Tax=Holospora curviuscula TaxID=1082868 RepID=A0A2S5RAA4_9PROT|nr:hypothetical protein HCUR_00421 [Holospora curviuscula]